MLLVKVMKKDTFILILKLFLQNQDFTIVCQKSPKVQLIVIIH